APRAKHEPFDSDHARRLPEAGVSALAQSLQPCSRRMPSCATSLATRRRRGGPRGLAVLALQVLLSGCGRAASPRDRPALPVAATAPQSIAEVRDASPPVTPVTPPAPDPIELDSP